MKVNGRRLETLILAVCAIRMVIGWIESYRTLSPTYDYLYDPKVVYFWMGVVWGGVVKALGLWFTWPGVVLLALILFLSRHLAVEVK